MTAPYRRQRRAAPSLPGAIANSPLTVCPCGKAAHRSRKAAKRFARQHHPAGDVRAYDCPHYPGTWHLGHLPAPVVAGRVPRAYAQQARRA